MSNLLQFTKYIFINMIDKKWIGATITVKTKNIRQTITIEDDPKMYASYRALGLDHIFTSQPKKMTFPRSEKPNKTKRRSRKKNDINLPESEQSGSVDVDGENNDK